MVARRIVLKSCQLESAVDALLAGSGWTGPSVATMRVKEAAPVQALLTQSILSTKLCLIPAIPTAAAVVILEAAGTVSAENPVSDSLPSFPSSSSSGVRGRGTYR